jgi:hypothetical protein
MIISKEVLDKFTSLVKQSQPVTKFEKNKITYGEHVYILPQNKAQKQSTTTLTFR